MSRFARRWSLRSAIIGIALLALLLASAIHLKRRHDHLWRRGLAHGRHSERIEKMILDDDSLDDHEANQRWRLVHWHGYVATYYFEAAEHPWLTFQADTSNRHCICRFCQADPWLPAESLRVPGSTE